jgi:serine/threonine protein kinase
MVLQRAIGLAPSKGAGGIAFNDNRTYVRHVEDVYIVGDQIGSGMCGTVHLCIHRETGEHYAVKIIDTKKFTKTPGLSTKDLREEAEMMKRLDHPNIIRIKDTFETDNIIFIVMELVRGGDLFDRILEKGRYSEMNARRVMGGILSAVSYLHSEEIIHRDLKPENILLVDPHDDTSVKITDFGLAKRTNQDGLKTFCGTPQYFAPEVLKRKSTVMGKGTYGTSADMWSLGVVLFILLSGAFPFDEDNLFDQVVKDGEGWG